VSSVYLTTLKTPYHDECLRHHRLVRKVLGARAAWQGSFAPSVYEFPARQLHLEILTGDHDSDPRPAPDNTAKMGIDIVSWTHKTVLNEAAC
jgi:hypothetical protein